MKVFCNLLIGISVMALTACSTPEPQAAAPANGTKVAAVKCNRVVDAPLSALMKKDCTSPPEGKMIDKEEFMNSLQVPGAVPQK